MLFVFYFFAAVLVLLGWQSLRGGISYLNFFKNELARPKSVDAPFCSIIAPCRGLDEDLRENLSALFKQNYPAYEIVFVVGDAADAAVEIIEAVREQSARPTKLIVAGRAVGESQKVHNLRRAVAEVAAESEAFAFVDSDARTGANWLRDLVAPLADEAVGATTGYRWFIAQKTSFASELRSVWNASIASALGANNAKNFCWGGSMAMRRATFERLNIGTRWRGTASDDFTVTRIMKEAGLPIRFVPQCLAATVEHCGFAEMLEFTTRQMKITRVYAADLWKAAFLGAALFAAVFWTGVVVLFFADGWHFRATLFFIAVIFALGAGKSYLRLCAVRMILKDYEAAMKRQLMPHLFLWTITPFVYFYNCSCALFSRKIRWRGIVYELKSATETEVSTTK